MGRTILETAMVAMSAVEGSQPGQCRAARRSRHDHRAVLEGLAQRIEHAHGELG